MKLLFFGDLAPTGFGTVTTDLGRALLDKGMDVRFLSQNDAQLSEPFASRTLDILTFVTARVGTQQGVEGLAGFVPDLLAGRGQDLPMADGGTWGDWLPDAAIVLADYRGAQIVTDGLEAAFRTLPVYHYVPVEGHDLPPFWRDDLWSIMQPIAMTEFGRMEIAKVMGTPPPMMYHGVDSDTFRPVTMTEPLALTDKIVLRSKADCKRLIGVHPKARLVVRADRFMPRKGYGAFLRAMTPVLEEREDVVLYLHCRSRDQGGDMRELISKMPRRIQNRVVNSDRGGRIPREALVATYNAADVYASVSAEGFGLTLAEAMACGVPAVGIQYSAVPEVIGSGGLVVPVDKHFDNEFGHYWALPDEEQFARSVGYLLDHPARARELGAAGRRHVVRDFTWTAAADVMTGLLEPAQELVAV